MATAAHPNPAADDRGQQADKPTEIPATGWKEIALRAWKETGKDNVGIVAAGVAFYGFLALVPLLGATVLTYGLFASPETVVRQAQGLTSVLPDEAARLIGEQLMNVVQTSGGKKGFGLLAALAVAFWGARNAAGSVVTALNIAYEEEETRGIVKTTLLALAITAGAVVLAGLAAGATAVLSALQHLLPDMGTVGLVFWRVVTYLLLAAAAAAAAATLYRYGPAREKAKWTWLTPGSIFFAVVWLALTLGFGFYVRNFGSYGATYGSLSAVVVLLTWLYLSSYVLLFGAELNSEIEHQTAKDTTDRPGDKPLGARGAWAADHVAAGKAETTEDQEQSSGLSQAGATTSSSAAQRGSGTAVEDSGGGGRAERVSRTGPLQHASRATSPAEAVEERGSDHPYLTSRITSRAGQIAGARKIGMVSSGLATLGLGFLRRRGKEKTGAALLATAAGLALWKRK